MAVAALAGAGRADAHAILQSSEPASGAALATSPTRIVLDFNEAVQFDLGGVTLTTASGSPVVIGKAHHRAGADDVVEASVPTLSPGVYVVGYRIVSADGHPVSGNIVFRVGAGSVAGVQAHGPRADRAVGVLYGLLRFAAYPALVAGGGAWLFSLLVWPGLWWRSRRMVFWSAVVLVVASLGQFVVAVPYLAGTGLSASFHARQWSNVAHTDVGRWLLVRASVALLLLLSLVRINRWRLGRSTGVVLAGAVLALLDVTMVGDGHAAVGRWLVLGWVATFVHIAAMCLWLAGLVVIAFGIRRRDLELLDAVQRRWSRVAAAAVVAIVASGVVQAWRLLPDVHALSSTYGRLLIGKSVLVAGMLLLGNLGRLALARHADRAWPSSLRRSVAVELVMGLAVVAVTTVLVQTEPGAHDAATAPAGASPSTSVARGGTPTPLTTTPFTTTPFTTTPFTTTLRLGQRSMTVALDGTTTGRHRLTLVVDDGAQPFADPVTLDARLTLAAKGLGPIPVLFSSDSRLHWSTDALELPVAGQWRLEVFVIDPATKARFATNLDITDPGAP
jgi:copper transport protein